MCQLCSMRGEPNGGFSCRDISSDGQGTSSVQSFEATPDNAPSFSIGQIVNQLRTQWGGSAEGTYRAWFSSDISYGINWYTSNGTWTGGETLVGMTAAMQNVARLGFELWDDLIARNLNEDTTSGGDANITFNYASITQGGGTYARPVVGGTQSSGYYPIQAQGIFLNSGWTGHDSDADLFYGGYGITTYVHEIGHALGLSHPGSYNAGSGGTITYANSAEFAQDNRQFTVMSYFGGYNPGTKTWTQDGGGTYFPSTPMVYDIAAIQATYGADYSTRAGNSTYGFNVTADVAARSANGLAVFNFAQNANPIFTIWDGGGSDTLDCSGYSVGQMINLTPGGYSNIGGMNGNIAIAFNCIIERAIGGGGNDLLIGNDAGNFLNGGGGTNYFQAGGGNDYVTATGNLNQAFGDAGSDQLYFNGNQNQLFGSEGHDWLGVNGTNNALVGGNGNEVWMGASGNSNTLNGEGGNDSLFANGAGNFLHGGADTDWLGVSGNSNALYGAAGNEWMGATGNGNYLLGGDDGDTLFSVGGNFLYGEGGGDWLGCSGNNNLLNGAQGNDYLASTGNNNTLDGGAGNDQLVAAGAHAGNRFVFHAGYGMDTISNFSRHGAGGTDVIDLAGFGLNFSSLQQYLSFQAGGVAVITIDAATTLTIANGIPPNGFLASDFIF